ncbi:hypothetical protein BFJ68_g16198 [Fusarium oxysporum]|uniref:Uncharacterized protein n=1 Tax=Fusarium oxysporum TaxID=5507 RepID=A0A420PFW8_FUSOX|nr:hypothetical protein FOMA001_g13591 [Fusarium oxysporum f. sp. matthiolae]RKK91418.1 hypothetical protein BFJ68_g16198 [Fusarium oxysporum]
MDGQHRIKALEAYVQATGAAEEELWWTCEFYDKDNVGFPRILSYPTAPPLPILSSPSAPSSSSVAVLIHRNIKRRPGFLTAVNDVGYYETYGRISRTRQLRIPNIYCIVSLVKDEGKVLFQVMSHVVAWLNAISTIVLHRRDNNKPPLRADLAATLEHYSDRNVQKAKKRFDAFVWDPNYPLLAPRAASILLQQEVLDFLIKHLTDFRNPAVKLYLDQEPKEIDYA